MKLSDLAALNEDRGRLKRALALQKRLALLDAQREGIMTELAQLGFDIPEGRSGTAREAPSTIGDGALGGGAVGTQSAAPSCRRKRRGGGPTT